MITAAELDDLRADAVREMPDRLSVLRFVRDDVDEDTLVAVRVYQELYAAVPAFVTRNVRSSQWTEQAGAPLERDNYTVVLDPAVVDIANGDLLTVASSGDPATPTLIVMSVTAGSATAGRRVFADRFGDGQRAPNVVVIPAPAPSGFGLAPFGTAEFGD